MGFVADGQPFVIPPLARAATASTSRLRREPHAAHAGGGVPVCVTVTLADGLVRPGPSQPSMNYRRRVLGTATVVEGEEKRAALEAMAEHVAPGRWTEARPPTRPSSRPAVLSIPLDEASAKVRTGPPVDEDEDYGLPHWAGVLPLTLAAGSPIPDPRMPPGVPVPPSVLGWRRPRGG